ncbi:MAG: hypothetical protein GXO89_10485 [Chlorobi bacterium]|nr:hypothetical protein [Chlorobiota bacterium]
MKAVLEINLNELNSNLLDMVRSMFDKNVTEIILKPQAPTLEEFDQSLSIEEILDSMQKSGHKAELITEIKDGLEESSIYSKHEG